jgi:hypothetical protein
MLPKLLPSFLLRVYYDSSVEDDPVLSKLRNNPRVQLIRFEHPWFKNDNIKASKIKGHQGVFGTLVRTLPLFDEDPHLRWVIVGDVDILSRKDIQPYVNIMRMVGSKGAKVGMHARYCGHLNTRMSAAAKALSTTLTPILNCFASIMRFPPKLLDEFLHCLHIPTKGAMCKYVSAFTKDTPHHLVKQAVRMGLGSPLSYGVDEVLLARIVKHVLDLNIPYVVIMIPDRAIAFTVYKQHPELLERPANAALVRKCLGKLYNQTVDIHANFNQLYKLLNVFHDTVEGKDNKYVWDRTVSVLMGIARKGSGPDHGLVPHVVKCVTDQRKGTQVQGNPGSLINPPNQEPRL